MRRSRFAYLAALTLSLTACSVVWSQDPDPAATTGQPANAAENANAGEDTGTQEGAANNNVANKPPAADHAEQEGPNNANKPLTVEGKVDRVTVYRGQALVGRAVTIPGPAGLKQVLVTNLPPAIDPSSLYAEAGNGLEIRSVSYRTRPVREDVRERVRTLDQKIQNTQNQLHTAKANQQVVDQHVDYLNDLEKFTAKTANLEVAGGVLDAKTLQSLSTYLLNQRQQMTNWGLDLDAKQRKLDKTLSLLRRKKSTLTRSSSDTVREAVIFVDLKKAGASLTLNYLVNNASWSPSYTARIGEQRKQVELEYYASVRQRSGEDWSNVTMTLATASPSLVAEAPKLAPLELSLTTANRQGPAARFDNASIDRLRQQLNEAQARAAQNYLKGKNAPDASGSPGQPSARLNQRQQANPQPPQSLAKSSPQFDLSSAQSNTNAGGRQVVELKAGKPKQEAGESARPTRRAQTQVSVEYDVPDRTSLPSREGRQLIRIASATMQGRFYKKATPVLLSQVYEQASVKNTSDRVLLAGPVTTYVGGGFVGRGHIPTVAKGERFTVGLGVDSSLRASRELVDKEQTVQGGNTVATYTYQLSVENFSKQPADVRLYDRLPHGKDQQLRVTLTEPGKPLSKGKPYHQNRRPKGILRWDLTVPAGATGTKATTVTYQFKMEYARNKNIGNQPLDKALKQAR